MGSIQGCHTGIWNIIIPVPVIVMWMICQYIYIYIIKLLMPVHISAKNDVELWCFLWYAPEQTVEQAIETSVIWDALVLIMKSLWCDMVRYLIHIYPSLPQVVTTRSMTTANISTQTPSPHWSFSKWDRVRITTSGLSPRPSPFHSPSPLTGTLSMWWLPTGTISGRKL